MVADNPKFGGEKKETRMCKIMETMESEEETEIVNKYEEMSDNILSINGLNDDCLRLIFQHLPIIEKIKIERGT